MRLGGRELDLQRPLLVGILNLTPDSFSDGGELLEPGQALARARLLMDQGADLLDLGGESTRPGATEVSEQQELERVVPAVRAITAALAIPVAVDTRRSRVAAEALRAGAVMINDVSGFSDPDMAKVVARANAAWVLMHMPHQIGAMGWSQPTADWPASMPK